MNTDFIIDSIVNRRSYLQHRKAEWAACSSEKKRSQIIVELIQLEPSHLWENWILDYVILWQQNLDKYRDYIEAAFLKKGKRPDKSKIDKAAWVRNMGLKVKVENLKKNNPSTAGAIREFIANADFTNKLDMESFDESLSDPKKEQKAIEARLKRLKKNVCPLPFPYYGRNVIKYPDRILFKFYDTRISFGGTDMFGEWSYEQPIDAKISAKFDSMYASLSPQ